MSQLFRSSKKPLNYHNIIKIFMKADGYARDNTLLKYKEEIKNPLFSYTYCHRFQMYYTRPRLLKILTFQLDLTSKIC